MKILNIKPPRGFNTLMRTVAKDYRNYRRARLQTWEAPLWTQLDMLDMYKNDFTHSRFILQEDGVERDSRHVAVNRTANLLVDRINKKMGWTTTTRDYSFILHLIYGGIDKHADEMSKSCFLFPVKSPDSTKFFVEKGCANISKVRLNGADCIYFSDFMHHGLEAHPASQSIVLSVTRDRRY
jgi:hypothetical protein